jgi:hypothetical protein
MKQVNLQLAAQDDAIIHTKIITPPKIEDDPPMRNLRVQNPSHVAIGPRTKVMSRGFQHPQTPLAHSDPTKTSIASLNSRNWPVSTTHLGANHRKKATTGMNPQKPQLDFWCDPPGLDITCCESFP